MSDQTWKEKLVSIFLDYLGGTDRDAYPVIKDLMASEISAAEARGDKLTLRRGRILGFMEALEVLPNVEVVNPETQDVESISTILNREINRISSPSQGSSSQPSENV